VAGATCILKVYPRLGEPLTSVTGTAGSEKVPTELVEYARIQISSRNYKDLK